MKTTTEPEYQTRELASFWHSKHAFFDNVKDFAETLRGMDIDEQIGWIENGSYGAGACLALQDTLHKITPRANGKARVSNTVLHAFYGKAFPYYSRLPQDVKEKVDLAVIAFMKRPHEFGMELKTSCSH